MMEMGLETERKEFITILEGYLVFYVSAHSC